MSHTGPSADLTTDAQIEICRDCSNSRKHSRRRAIEGDHVWIHVLNYQGFPDLTTACYGSTPICICLAI